MQTKLDAINACLRGIGAAPVTEGNLNLDAGIAEQVIDSVIDDLLSRSWWFNREPNWKLTPNPVGTIEIPNNVIDLVTTDKSRDDEVTIRGRRLYDVINHTYDFRGRLGPEGSITCTFTVTMPFEDLPQIAKKAVTYIARRIFAQDLEVDSTRWQFQSKDEAAAIMMLERQEAKQRKFNYRRNAAVELLRSKAGGYNGMSGYRMYRGARGERS